MTRLPKKCSDFLERVLARIRSRQVKESSRAELESHLQDSIEHLQEKGVPEEEAVELALLKLGDPAELGKNISIANRPFYARFSFLAAGAAVAGVVAFFGLTFYLERITAEALLEANARKDQYEKDFFEDQKILSEIEFFGSLPTNKKDAGEFLNPRIVWEPRHHSPDWPEIELPRAAEKILLQVGPVKRRPWVELDSPELERVDLSWMNNLHAYDHWDLFASGVGPAHTHMKFRRNPFTVPTPSFRDFSHFAKLRLLRGLRTQQPLAAFRDVRQLAKLVYSTETLVGAMVGISILGMERDAYSEALKRGFLKAGDWQPISEELQLRARRSLFGMAAWVNPTRTGDQNLALLQRPHSKSGICGAVNEYYGMFFYVEKFYRGQAPLEPAARSSLSAADSLLGEANGCRATYVRSLRQNGGGSNEEDPLWSSSPTQLAWNLMHRYGHHIPYLRRVIGNQMISFASGRYYAVYANVKLPARDLSGK